jgi:anti-sigma factor RsiW
MIDDPDARTGVDARHLQACPECEARFQAVSKDALAISSLLAVPDPHINVAQALQRVRSAPDAQPRFGFRLPVARPGSRPMVIAFAAAVVAVALLVVGVAQGGVVFAPSSVTPVPVTLADMQALSQLSAYGTVSWTKQPQFQVAASAADAATVSGGLQAPKVKSLPQGVSSTITYAAMSQAVAVFTFSADKAAAAAAGTGKALPKMPAGMDGVKLTVTIGPAVGEVYGDLKPPTGSDVSQANLPELIVGKSSAPTATSSSSQITVKQMESYLLTLPGISPDLAAAIKAIGDPSTTLPIPVPIQYATSSKVEINGVQGIALGDNTGVGSGVIWVKDGIVYAVAGTIKQSDAINIADNLK